MLIADFADNLVEDYKIRKYLKEKIIQLQVFLRLKLKEHANQS